MTSVSFPLIPGKPDVEFRFTIKTARELDKASQFGVQRLLENTQTTEAIVLMTCYGLRHADHKMTEVKAEDLIQRYLDNDGDSTELFKALFTALKASGLYGKAERDEVNPTKTDPTTETTTA